MGEGVSQEKATKQDLEGKSAAPRSSAVRRCSGALLVVPSSHAMTAWFHGLKTLGHMPHSYSQGHQENKTGGSGVQLPSSNL